MDARPTARYVLISEATILSEETILNAAKNTIVILTDDNGVQDNV